MWMYIFVTYILKLYLMSSCHIAVTAASFEINNGMQCENNENQKKITLQIMVCIQHSRPCLKRIV